MSGWINWKIIHTAVLECRQNRVWADMESMLRSKGADLVATPENVREAASAISYPHEHFTSCLLHRALAMH